MRELSDFDEMYQEVIIDHYKNPRNKTKLTNFIFQNTFIY